MFFPFWKVINFAGVISLNAINNEEKTAELDYWIAVPFWNRGIGTEAVKQAIKYAFEKLNLEIIRSACLAKNKGSIRVLEKNRFNRINEFVFEDGKFKGEVGYRYQLNK